MGVLHRARGGPVRSARSLGLLQGHLGSSVSALVDGQLDPAAAERAWRHVAGCPACCRLVEREGWVKRQLAKVAEAPRAGTPSERLVGSLLDLDPAAVAWAETDDLEDRGWTRRRVAVVLVGASSVSAVVIAITALGGPGPGPLGTGGDAPATTIGGTTSGGPEPVPVPGPVRTVRVGTPGPASSTTTPAFLPTRVTSGPTPVLRARPRQAGTLLALRRPHASAHRDR